MDETGLQEGESFKGKVLGHVHVRRTENDSLEASCWVSIIESITADGERLTPIVIFQGENPQAQ